MRQLVNTLVIFVVTVLVTTAGRPVAVHSGARLQPGWRSASEATALQLGRAGSGPVANGGAAMNVFSFSDTTDYEFPEDEEEERNVVKDAVLWTAVAGVVAFFVIKVFLQGDTDIPPPPPNKKPPPPPPTVSGTALMNLTW